ncbi:MAG: isoprenyl transferase [Bacteroidaceae bacterium]|nr:isoprenyl transferase [Bacteroidaceae bacterium]
MDYIEQIDKNNIPRHIAIIMDGNGRWAQQRGLERSQGHQAGVAAVRKLVENALNLGVRYLTLYTFSTENWNRPVAEVAALMALLFESVEEEIFIKNNVSFKIVGDMSMLPDNVRERLEACISRTSGGSKMTMVLALSYSARWEITEAARSLAAKVERGELKASEITEQTITDALTTNFMPDPDLLIRTGKEVRLSNFLLWQAAYSELYFTDVLWPDFDNQQLCKAVYEYQHRQRRFGLTGEQVTNEDKDDKHA